MSEIDSSDNVKKRSSYLRLGINFCFIFIYFYLFYYLFYCFIYFYFYFFILFLFIFIYFYLFLFIFIYFCFYFYLFLFILFFLYWKTGIGILLGALASFFVLITLIVGSFYSVIKQPRLFFMDLFIGYFSVILSLIAILIIYVGWELFDQNFGNFFFFFFFEIILSQL